MWLCAAVSLGAAAALACAGAAASQIGWRGASALATAAFAALPARRAVVEVDGRRAYVYRPRGADATLLPAVVVLHGSGCRPSDYFGVGLEPLADRWGFLVVYPEMRQPGSDEWGYREDIPFFAALLERLRASDFGLDPARVFVSGHSAGGTMALLLQNEAADLFAASAAVSAGVGHLEQWSLAREGRPCLLVWNHADPVLAEYGGEQLYSQTVETLRRRGSRAPVWVEPLPLSGTVVSAELRKYEQDGAPEMWEVFWRTSPGTHAWPQKLMFSVDASQLMVDFFFRQPTS